MSAPKSVRKNKGQILIEIFADYQLLLDVCQGIGRLVCWYLKEEKCDDGNEGSAVSPYNWGMPRLNSATMYAPQ